MKILAFDTETGGLDPKDSSLLSAYFAIVDSNTFEIEAELDMLVKPNDDLIKANPQALAVNNIKIEEHLTKAMPYSAAQENLKSFLKKHSPYKGALTPLAHNIDFDLGFVHEYLLPKSAWEQHVSYRKMDTANLANFFRLCGWFPESQKMSLGELATYFGIEFEGTGAHSASADVKVMVKILKEMVNPLRESK